MSLEGLTAVLMGGKSAEREISLRSGTGVMQALSAAGLDVIAFDPATEPMQALKDRGVSRCFIALHGRYGEDGTVQGALEILGIPYTGSGVLASALAMDKVLTKRIWQSRGIPTPSFITLTSADLPDPTMIETLGMPVAVKPAREGSSLGFTRLNEAHGLGEAVAKASRYDDTVLVESFIHGREFTVALLGGGALGPVRALPVIEIVAPQGHYDYQHKYFGNETQYECPAPIDSLVTTQMQALSQKAFEALGCEGWARVDILWDEKTSPTLLELNTSPGMTDHSLVPMAAAQAGLSYTDLVLEILSGARLKIGGMT